MASAMSHETCMSGGRLSGWRYSILALLGLNLSVPLVIGGLIAVAESGDPRVLMCGAAVAAMVAGVELLRRRRTAYGSRTEVATSLN